MITKKFKGFRIVCVSVLFFCIAGLVSATGVQSSRSAESYWVSFTIFHSNNSRQSGTRYLMKIDSAGKTILAPKAVLTPEQFESTSPATAISHHGANRINLWVPGDPISEGPSFVYRSVFDKATLALITLIRTGVTTTNVSYLKVTQRRTNNFAAVQTEASSSFAYDFSATDLPARNRKTWVISRNAFPECFNPDENCSGFVSSDGRTAAWYHASIDWYPTLHIQRLDDSGLPSGPPNLIVMDTVSGGLAVSNVLRKEKIFVIYKRPADPVFFYGPDHLLLRIVDWRSGKLALRKPIRIDVNPTYVDSVAIDPLGRFVLFSSTSYGTLPSSFLIFQALDETGHRKGKPKLLLNERAFGLDILKD